MRADVITTKPIYSSFLSCDKDTEKILKTLFVSSRPYSDRLKRLLIINEKDCLDMDNENYQRIINSISLGDMINKNYIKFDHKIARGTHEQIKSYIIVNFDNFTPNMLNPAYLDYTLYFDIVCNHDAWKLNDYQIRPIVICGYIDGILNSLSKSNAVFEKNHKPQIKLTGPGYFNFIRCDYVNLNEDFSAYTLSYKGMYLSQDIQLLGEVNNEN